MVGIIWKYMASRFSAFPKLTLQHALLKKTTVNAFVIVLVQGTRQMLKHVGASLSYNKHISRMHNTDLLTAWIQMDSSWWNHLFVIRGQHLATSVLIYNRHWKLVWAVTIHKAQGLILNKLCVELARRNFPPASHLLWSPSGQCVWRAIENKRKSHWMSQKQLYSIIIVHL